MVMSGEVSEMYDAAANVASHLSFQSTPTGIKSHHHRQIHVVYGAICGMKLSSCFALPY